MPIEKYTLLNSPFSPYVAIPVVVRSLEDDANQAGLRSVLQDKTIVQVDMLIRTIKEEEWKSLPPVLHSMALENPHILKGLLNMLGALCHFLTVPWRADIREKLAVVFSPIDEWVQGQYCVTTPALLVVQSILYSHCEWFREELFESYSAVRAFEEMEVLGLPKSHRYFIAGIIAHQTLLRAAWTKCEGDPREVYGIYKKDNGLDFADDADDKVRDEVIGAALQGTLFPFAATASQQHGKCKQGKDKEDYCGKPPQLQQRQLAAALILHSLCLQCRHSRYAFKENSQELNPKIKDSALKFLDYILAPECEQKYPGARLAFFQYGRYVDGAKNSKDPNAHQGLLDQAKAYVRETLREKQQNDNTNLAFCFPRVLTKKIWQGVSILPDSNKDGNSLVPEAKGTVANRDNPHVKCSIDDAVEWKWESRLYEATTLGVAELVKETVGKMYKVELDLKHHLLKLLGINENQYSDIEQSIDNWKDNKLETLNLINQILPLLNPESYKTNDASKTSGKLFNEPYLPAPLVGMMLRALHEIKPDCFTLAHIICLGIGGRPVDDSTWENTFSIWLPNDLKATKANFVDHKDEN